MLLTASLASCDKHTLTARSAKKAIEKETAFRDSSQVVQIGIGYYEVDSAAKQKLEALAKEGVISCKISGIAERHRFEKYTWWEGTKVFYKDITHYFAEVSLTEEGKKFTVSNPPVKPLGEDNIPEADYHNMSADSLQTEAFSDNSANVSADAVSENSASPIQKDTTGNANPYSEALKKVIDFGFSELRLHRICARIMQLCVQVHRHHAFRQNPHKPQRRRAHLRQRRLHAL